MAHHNFYDSLGLDRGKDAEALGKDIDARLSSPSLDDATRDELQVARRILGDPGRRTVYDTRLDDPAAPTIDVPALRQMAAAEPSTPSQPSAPTQSSAQNTKPKQYFPETDPEATAVRPEQQPGQSQYQGQYPGQYPGQQQYNYGGQSPYQGQGAYTDQYPAQYSGQYPSQYPAQHPAESQYNFTGQGQYQNQYPGQYQGQYTEQYPAQPATGEPQSAEFAETAQPTSAETGKKKKKSATKWLIGAILIVLLAIAGTGWWLWKNLGQEDWNSTEARMADTFPQIISEKSGQKGWLGMQCVHVTPNDGEEARIRCADEELGVSIVDYDTEEDRERQLPEGNAEIIGNDHCSARSFKMENANPPAYMIAPEDDGQYLLVVNGKDAESKRLYLNLCEKSRA